MFGYFKRRRRNRLRSSPCPPRWLAIIYDRVPIYKRLPTADQTELQGHLRVLLEEKHYEGCGGLELTEEIRVTIAAHASVLLLHRQTDYFPRLISILVYPSAYVASKTSPLGGGVVVQEEEVRLGEAWKDGVVVLSWADLGATAAGRNPGRNLVLHEFAHQLDMEDGAADGTPLLTDPRRYERWRAVMEDAFEGLRRDAALGRYSVLDPYGASDAAEFFAVATEAFFEKPTLLHRRHPRLYQELKAYYRQDPATWAEPRPAPVEPTSGPSS
jgi:Mlc titration factor MtfA (ptsG expression regulator)